LPQIRFSKPMLSSGALGLHAQHLLRPAVQKATGYSKAVQKGALMFASLTEARKQIEPRVFRDLHQKALDAVARLKVSEVHLIAVLQEVDAHRVYRCLGFSSLYRYCTEALGLSEAQAYNYIAVARKAVEVPALKAAVESGEITISKARRITSVINEENQEKWLCLAQDLTQRQLEKEVATAHPLQAAPESTRFINDSVLEMRVNVNEATFLMLERVKEILREKHQSAVSSDQALKALCGEFLGKHDPVVKAERILKKNGAQAKDSSLMQEEWLQEQGMQGLGLPAVVNSQRAKIKNGKNPDRLAIEERETCQEDLIGAADAVAKPVLCTVAKARTNTNTNTNTNANTSASASANENEHPSPNPAISPGASPPKRKPLPALRKHQLWLHQKGQCQHREANGQQCDQRIFLHVHHQTPISQGGDDSLENLTLICSYHHRRLHQFKRTSR
jgi:hypothetical protein